MKKLEVNLRGRERETKSSNLPPWLELTEDETKVIQKSQEFVEFIDSSTKIVERALNEKYDFMKDYTLGIDIEK